MMKRSRLIDLFLLALAVLLIAAALAWVWRWAGDAALLRKMVERLSADTRTAEVLVTKSEYDETEKKVRTTVKFLEYDISGKPLEPRYFTFSGNILQFQALVIRFRDDLVKAGDRLRGKSAYLFMKAFVLDGEKTQEFVITEVDSIPEGYRVSKKIAAFEQDLWRYFWRYALDPEKRSASGVKNAQIEAPGTWFQPGSIYTLSIEHDGGLRIDAKPLPAILDGEKIETSRR
ncbi:MAG: hypothetical protein ACOY3K_03595 [Candidatus Omnitrophota bacterium]